MSTTHTRPVDTAVPGPAPQPVSRWTPGRIVGLTLAAAAVVASGVMASAAVGVHQIDEEHRDGGYLTTDTARFTSTGHAVTVEKIDLDGLSGDWLMGTARLRATGVDGSPVFVGVAPAADVADYLDGVGHSEVDELDGTEYVEHEGGAPDAAPTDTDIWTEQASGEGTQSVSWKPTDGEWAVVVMNPDGSAGVDVRADVGATAPILPRAVRLLAAASLLSGITGGLAVLLILRLGRRSTPRGRSTSGRP